MENLKETLASAEQQVVEQRKMIKKLEKEMREAQNLISVYEQGLSVGKQAAAMLQGMVDGGLSEDFAKDLVKAAAMNQM